MSTKVEKYGHNSPSNILKMIMTKMQLIIYVLFVCEKLSYMIEIMLTIVGYGHQDRTLHCGHFRTNSSERSASDILYDL